MGHTGLHVDPSSTACKTCARCPPNPTTPFFGFALRGRLRGGEPPGGGHGGMGGHCSLLPILFLAAGICFEKASTDGAGGDQALSLQGGGRGGPAFRLDPCWGQAGEGGAMVRREGWEATGKIPTSFSLGPGLLVGQRRGVVGELALRGGGAGPDPPQLTAPAEHDTAAPEQGTLWSAREPLDDRRPSGCLAPVWQAVVSAASDWGLRQHAGPSTERGRAWSRLSSQPPRRTASVPQDLEERLAAFAKGQSTARSSKMTPTGDGGSTHQAPSREAQPASARPPRGSNQDAAPQEIEMVSACSKAARDADPGRVREGSTGRLQPPSSNNPRTRGVEAVDAMETLAAKRISQQWHGSGGREAKESLSASALVSMSPAAAESYGGGYAALHWSADGTSAQGLVPVSYESSRSSSPLQSDSSQPDDYVPSSHTPVRGLADGDAFGEDSREQMSPGGLLSRRMRSCCASVRSATRTRPSLSIAVPEQEGEHRAELVRKAWEKQGFTTYVALDGDDTDRQGQLCELGWQAAEQWRLAAAAHTAPRAKLYTAEKVGSGVHICAVAGRRGCMEDTVACYPTGASGASCAGGWRLYGVFDGHGGDKASLYCRAHLLSNTAGCLGGGESEGVREALERGFEMTDRHFVADAERNEWMDGSTGLVVALGADSVFIANAGDSRAVLAEGGDADAPAEGGCVARAVSKDHTADDEEEQGRIEKLGGLVVARGGVARVMGVLRVARAIGDAPLRPYVSAEPDIEHVERGKEQKFLIMATDGLWDVVTNQEAVDEVWKCLSGGSSFTGNCAEVLAGVAFDRGSTDNISVIVLDLRQQQHHHHDSANE